MAYVKIGNIRGFTDEEFAASRFDRGELPEGTDLASTTPLAQGLWTVSLSSLGNTISDWPIPAPASRTGSVLVVKTGTRYTYTVTSTSTGEIYQKVMPAGAWRPWEKIHPFPQEHTGVSNQLLVEDFTRRMGGAKSTGGLGAVSFRFDHGLNNFKTKVLPLLQTHGIKASLALNSRTWTDAANNAVTQAEVDGWVSDGYVEIWNHGATHGDAVTASALTTEIVTSLAELRAQLPSAQIDGFAVPGVGGTNYGGFDGGATSADFFGTVAGRMILANHAVSSGSISGSDQRILDGVVRNGQAHFTLDAQTAATAKAKINTVKTTLKGQQFMLHPSVLDTAGNMTTAALSEVLAYAAAERDAGRVAVLSPYEMLVASSAVPAGSSGSGIEQVSGTVALDGTGDPIREFYTTGATTFTTNGNPTLISSMTAVVWRRDGAGVWGYKEVSGWTVPAADTTAPTAGTLASSNLVYNGVRLTVSGASDAVALHSTPYRFSTNNGSTWSAWQSPAFYDATGLSGSTTYTCKAEVRDAAGNTAQTASISVTTPAAPADTTAPTAGTLASSAITTTGFTITISGASDAVGLHATPYAFSTDNGSTWSAYQSGASLAVTGKTASTAYQCIGRVRDAAGNTAMTAAITVTTSTAVALKTAVSNLSPTLFAPLDDVAGTTSPVNLGSGGATLTATNSTFGNAGFASGSGSWMASASAGGVNGPVDTIDGDTTCSGFIALKLPVNLSGETLLMGVGNSWKLTVAPVGGGAEVGVGFYPSDAVALYTTGAAKVAFTAGMTVTIGFSVSAAGSVVYVNGVQMWTGAATTMKASAAAKTVIQSGLTTTPQAYCSALWSGTALTAQQHLDLATAAGVA